jgi:hypothetical protein
MFLHGCQDVALELWVGEGSHSVLRQKSKAGTQAPKIKEVLFVEK